jgi:filamentous hemagglutinin
LKNKGHEDELTALMQLCAVGGVSFRAPHVVVEFPFSKDKSPYLSPDPLLNWMHSLQNNSNVTWKLVGEDHKQWSHKTQGMTIGAQVLLTIAMSVVTGGVGGTLIGATAGSLQAALASPLFTAFCSQAAVSLINNQGNLSTVFKEMSSSQSLISLGTSTVMGGISHQFGPSSLNTFTDHFHNAGVQCIPVTTVSVLRNPDMKQALKQGLLDIGVSFAGSYGAQSIGELYHPIDPKTPPISWLEHKVLHGILGAAMGTALSEDRKNGALSGALGALSAEIIATVSYRIEAQNISHPSP